MVKVYLLKNTAPRKGNTSKAAEHGHILSVCVVGNVELSQFRGRLLLWLQ